jgi:hypothetical protein
MTDFHTGQNLIHPEHGDCTVTFVGKDYVGVEFNDGGNALVKKDAFLCPPVPYEQTMAPPIRPSTWPESTFVYEAPDAQHFLGSHWDAFFEDTQQILKRLPTIVQSAEPWIGGVNQKPTRPLPDEWIPGFVLVWPNHRQGLMVIISPGKENNELKSFYPFATDGGQHSLIIRQINVWESGVEAQIEVEIGITTIIFFDIAFAKHRLWYEGGKSYEFILMGIAYGAKPSEVMEMPIKHNPDQISWQRVLAENRGEPIPEEPTILSLRGMAMFMQVDGWDIDDYSFRGPIKSVKDVHGEILGQEGWFVRVTVLRFDDNDFNLDILITKRSWQGDSSPAIGQDIEGRLWLQGYLWDA